MTTSTHNSIITSTDDIERMREEFNKSMEEFYKQRLSKPEWDSKRVADVIHRIEMFSAEPNNRDANQYYYYNMYEVKLIDGKKVLTHRKKEAKSNNVIRIVPTEEYFNILLKAHLDTKHGGRDKIVNLLKDKMYIPTTIAALFPRHCRTCQGKRNTKRSLMIATDYNRGSIHIIDMDEFPQESKEYTHLLYYQDSQTNFCYLRALTDDSPFEVAKELVKIFLEFGCPAILNTTRDPDFTAAVVESLKQNYLDSVVVAGKLANPEECEEDIIKTKLHSWMKENKSSKWSLGVHFVQHEINNIFTEDLNRTPFKAMFGVSQRMGIDTTDIPKKIVQEMKTEEDLFKWISAKDAKKARKGNNKRDKCKPDSDVKEQKSDNADSTASTSTKAESAWCWVCGEGDDDAVSFLCDSCKGPIHEACGKFKDNSKTTLVCNLCLKEDEKTESDKMLVIKVEPVELTIDVTDMSGNEILNMEKESNQDPFTE